MTALRRHLSSPQEVIAAFRSVAADPAHIDLRTRAWQEVQHVDVRLQGAGQMAVAPIGFLAIVIVSGGRTLVGDSAASVPMRAVPDNAMLALGPGRGFSYGWTSPVEIRIACLDTTVVRRAADEMGIAATQPIDASMSISPRDQTCDHLMELIASEAALPAHPAQSMMIECVASALACHILARAAGNNGMREVPFAGLSGRAFQKVRAYVEDNLGEHISLEALAAVVGISRFHFARQFRLRTGESPMGFLLRARIERAKTMLRAQTVTVAEIAATLGFADQSHFTRTFRRMVGMPPSHYSGPRSARNRGAEAPAAARSFSPDTRQNQGAEARW